MVAESIYSSCNNPVQTFLPFADFAASAKVLDNKRLGKQRVENLQILKALLDPSYGWQHHPAVKMWRGYELPLAQYHKAMVDEWMSRGYVDTTWQKFMDVFGYKARHGYTPSWLGDERVHKTHRSNLLRKDPVYYGQFGWTEPSNLCYYWPIK
jgi:hypothetical protein